MAEMFSETLSSYADASAIGEVTGWPSRDMKLVLPGEDLLLGLVFHTCVNAVLGRGNKELFWAENVFLVHPSLQTEAVELDEDRTIKKLDYFFAH